MRRTQPQDLLVLLLLALAVVPDLGSTNVYPPPLSFPKPDNDKRQEKQEVLLLQDEEKDSP